MNRSEIKDFNKFKQALIEKWGISGLLLYTQGLNSLVPEDMEDIVRQHNEEFDRAERFKTYQALKQEFETEEKVEERCFEIGDKVYVHCYKEVGHITRLPITKDNFYKVKLERSLINLTLPSCEFTKLI